MQEKRAFEKDTDETYKATISKIPDAKQKVDPWGSMRTAPQKQSSLYYECLLSGVKRT
jgi:hypothetical protein